MRLNFIALAVLGGLIGITAFGGGMPSGSTNKAVVVTGTNQVGKLGTNQLAKPATNGVATNKVLVAEDPGDEYTNSLGMELTKVPGGYWAGKYEVTQKEYKKVMGSNPSAFSGDKRPVDSVSWNNAMDFCQKLTELEIKEKALPEGYRYSLPTEEEWQALAAGTPLTSAVTSQGTSRSATSTVGSLPANGLGLFDMRGNVSELVMGDTSKPFRVALGGSWQDWIEINLRPEFRLYPKPEEAKNTMGFRCVLRKR